MKNLHSVLAWALFLFSPTISTDAFFAPHPATTTTTTTTTTATKRRPTTGLFGVASSSASVQTVSTQPIAGMQPGTSGLRKKTKVWIETPHYVENFIQSLIETAAEKLGKIPETYVNRSLWTVSKCGIVRPLVTHLLLIVVHQKSKKHHCSRRWSLLQRPSHADYCSGLGRQSSFKHLDSTTRHHDNTRRFRCHSCTTSTGCHHIDGQSQSGWSR